MPMTASAGHEERERAWGASERWSRCVQTGDGSLVCRVGRASSPSGGAGEDEDEEHGDDGCWWLHQATEVARPE